MSDLTFGEAPCALTAVQAVSLSPLWWSSVDVITVKSISSDAKVFDPTPLFAVSSNKPYDTIPPLHALPAFDSFARMTLTAGESSLSESHASCYESLMCSTRHFPTSVGLMRTESSIDAIAEIDSLSLSAVAELDAVFALYQR